MNILLAVNLLLLFTLIEESESIQIVPIPYLFRRPCCRNVYSVPTLQKLEAQIRQLPPPRNPSTDDRLMFELIETVYEKIKYSDGKKEKSEPYDITEFYHEHDPKLTSEDFLRANSKIPVKEDGVKKIDPQKAYACSQLQCPPEDTVHAVCACNYKTGKVATFKNECDLKKHNCRFDTVFKAMLNEICPWEFETMRTGEQEFDYSGQKYYNTDIDLIDHV